MSKMHLQTIIAVVGILSAAVLAFYGKSGWGWILLVTALVAT